MPVRCSAETLLCEKRSGRELISAVSEWGLCDLHPETTGLSDFVRLALLKLQSSNYLPMSAGAAALSVAAPEVGYLGSGAYSTAGVSGNALNVL